MLTIQKEVAERICAQPGELSLLALSVQIYGNPRIMNLIPAEDFYPQPKVDSAILRVDMYAEPKIAEERINTFFTLAKAGFSQKRKTLRNSLSGGLRISPDNAGNLLQKSGVDPMRRAETLSIDEWSSLATQYSDKSNY